MAESHRSETQQCRICGAFARYSYVGVIVCPSCKTFFKRNAEMKRTVLKCHYDGHCEINVNNRHTCASCRLEKCFSSGMQVDLLRASITRTNRSNRPTTTTNVTAMISTQNILQLDQSTFTVDQWNLLCNIIHCYDEHSQLYNAQHFVHEESKLPVRMRFKMDRVHELFGTFVASTRLMFEMNTDFRSLSLHDQSFLLHTTIRHVGAMAVCFLLAVTQLLDDPGFYQVAQSIYGELGVLGTVVASRHLDPDPVITKLILALLIFSTFGFTFYNGKEAKILEDLPGVVRIQDRYVELIWRYLQYKYDHRRAVLSFSNIIGCLFALHRSIVEMIELELYSSMIESVVKQTEETLGIIE